MTRLPENPFFASEDRDEADAALAASAAGGDRQALEDIIRRHQPWIFNLAIRMVLNPQEAADLTQEVLLRIVTRIAQFHGRSAFRTWVYRIAVNCMLDAKRGGLEEVITDFEGYGADLDSVPLTELSLPATLAPDRALIVEEAKVACMLGMLLCLNREQRIVYILGDIFEAPSDVAGAILSINPATFRQRLSRARRELIQFMEGKCGLINRDNPCRCDRKATGFMKAGWLDPEALKFTGKHLARVRAKAAAETIPLDRLVDQAYADLFRSHPMQQDKQDFQFTLHRILESPEAQRIFDL